MRQLRHACVVCFFIHFFSCAPVDPDLFKDDQDGTSIVSSTPDDSLRYIEIGQAWNLVTQDLPFNAKDRIEVISVSQEVNALVFEKNVELWNTQDLRSWKNRDLEIQNPFEEVIDVVNHKGELLIFGFTKTGLAAYSFDVNQELQVLGESTGLAFETSCLAQSQEAVHVFGRRKGSTTVEQYKFSRESGFSSVAMDSLAQTNQSIDCGFSLSEFYLLIKSEIDDTKPSSLWASGNGKAWRKILHNISHEFTNPHFSFVGDEVRIVSGEGYLSSKDGRNFEAYKSKQATISQPLEEFDHDSLHYAFAVSTSINQTKLALWVTGENKSSSQSYEATWKKEEGSLQIGSHPITAAYLTQGQTIVETTGGGRKYLYGLGTQDYNSVSISLTGASELHSTPHSSVYAINFSSDGNAMYYLKSAASGNELFKSTDYINWYRQSFSSDPQLSTKNCHAPFEERDHFVDVKTENGSEHLTVQWNDDGEWKKSQKSVSSHASVNNCFVVGDKIYVLTFDSSTRNFEMHAYKSSQGLTTVQEFQKIKNLTMNEEDLHVLKGQDHSIVFLSNNLFYVSATKMIHQTHNIGEGMSVRAGFLGSSYAKLFTSSLVNGIYDVYTLPTP